MAARHALLAMVLLAAVLLGLPLAGALLPVNGAPAASTAAALPVSAPAREVAPATPTLAASRGDLTSTSASATTFTPRAPSDLTNCDPLDYPLWICIGTSPKVGSITPTTEFTTSPVAGADRVYFQICDNGFDHQANVSIFDPNATRDGLTDPVKEFAVPLGAGTLCGGNSFDSTQGPTPTYFLVPSALALGGTWLLNVTASTKGAEMGQVAFHVDTYFVQLTPDQTYHLPGDHATVYYQVLSYASQGPVAGTLAFGLNGLYVNESHPALHFAPLPGLTPPSAGAQGAVTLTIPTNAQTNWWAGINLWANLTISGGTNTETARLLFTIAQVIAPALCAATTTDGGPNPCTPAPTAFPLGSQVVVREIADMGDLAGISVGQPIANAAFTLEVRSAGLPISPPSFPTSVTGDASGTAREVLDTTQLKVSTVTIYVNVSDPNDPSLTNDSSLTFNLTSSIQVAVQITLSSPQVFGGDSLYGNFSLVEAGGAAAPGGWLAYEYQVYFDAGSSTCPTAPVGQLELEANLTGATGAIPGYPVQNSMNGLLEVVVYAHNGTSVTAAGIFALACSLASPPQIAVNPSETSYLPGDTVGVSITPEGATLTQGSPTYYASVVGFATVTGRSPCSGTSPEDLYGQAVSGTSFSFTIPKQGASLCYEISVSAQTTGGFVTGQDVEIDELSGYTLGISIATPSQYADGSYQPGETLTLDYTVAPIGSSTTVPNEITLFVYVGNLPYQRIQQASTSGSLSVTIPSSQGAGIVLIEVTGSIPTPASGTYGVSAVTGVEVEPSPSFLGYDLGAGSQFTVGELLLVIALAVLVVLGVLWWRRQQWQSSSRHFHDEHGSTGEVRPGAPEEGTGIPSGNDLQAPAPGGESPAPPTLPPPFDPTSLEPPAAPPPQMPPPPPPL